MAKHLQVIEFSIKGHIVVDRDMNKQLEALTALKAAHESGDYSTVIAMATVDAVKAQQKSRRFEDATEERQTSADANGSENPPTSPEGSENGHEGSEKPEHTDEEKSEAEGSENPPTSQEPDGDGVPAFLRRKGKQTAEAMSE